MGRNFTINSAMAAAIEELGAELMIDMPGIPEPGDLRAQLQARGARLRAIIAAERAGVGTEGDEDRWVEDEFQAPGVVPRVTVLWDRPSLRSSRHRVALRSWMGQVGIDPSEVAHVWAFPLASTIPPLEAQVDHYRASTMKVVETVGAPYLLLVGDIVKQMWRRDLKLRQVQGTLAVWGGWYVWPIQNPIQCIADPHLIGPIRETVVGFCEAVREGRGLMELNSWCVEEGCTAKVWVYDPEGVPWCKAHAKNGLTKRENVMKNRVKRGNQRIQEVML